MSSYPVTDTEKLWIITGTDRSVTTLLLPEEYLRDLKAKDAPGPAKCFGEAQRSRNSVG